MRASEGANLIDASLLIEAVEDGWWYATLLPDERFVATFMTSPPFAALARRSLNDYWADQMGRTQYIRRRAVGFVSDGDIYLKSANSCCCSPVAGRRWLAVGDAAISFDPLSSMGISKALRMGLIAGVVIQQSLTGDETAIVQYDAAIAQEFNEYLITRNFYYRQEQRWADKPFWYRRHG